MIIIYQAKLLNNYETTCSCILSYQLDKQLTKHQLGGGGAMKQIYLSMYGGTDWKESRFCIVVALLMLSTT